MNKFILNNIYMYKRIDNIKRNKKKLLRVIKKYNR